jgi:lipid-A-disaccharide synthase
VIAGPRILLSAAEPSADQYAALLVPALERRLPRATIEGIGGPHLAATRARIRWRMEELSAMGFTEIAAQIPRHYRLLRTLETDARGGRFDLAILLDYPGFHLRLGRRLRQAGARVLYYVAPQLWAWRPGRLPALRRAADRVALVLPFEEGWFGPRGVSCSFVGHPLLDRCSPEREAARRSLDLPDKAVVLGIFPGSRPQEIQHHWPLFLEVARRMLAEGRVANVIVAATPAGRYPDAGEIRLHRGDPREVMAASTAALVKSGTATLEAALTGTPLVVVYRTSRLTYEIARRLLTVEHVALVNLLAPDTPVPEFWRHPLSPDSIAAALRPLLDPRDPAHRAQTSALAGVRERLGTPGASERVAAMAAELLSA